MVVLGREATEDPQSLAATGSVLAAAAALAGDHAEALSRARRTVEFADALGLRSDTVRWAWPIAADAALALGDRAAVTNLLDVLTGHRPGHVPAALRADERRIRARLLALDNDPAAADEFDAATKTLRELELPYYLAVCLADSAEYHAANGDTQRAAELAEEAARIAAKLGARPLLERAQRLVTPASTGELDPTQRPVSR